MRMIHLGLQIIRFGTSIRPVFSEVAVQSRSLSSTGKFSKTGRSSLRSTRIIKRSDPSTVPAVAGPPPPSPSNDDPWMEVTDKSSGLKYFWNTQTNETTALGAPKPGPSTAAVNSSSGSGVMGGLGRVVAEGFAFGVGSSVAHGLVGSMFGGSSHSSGDSSSADEGDFDL